MTREATTEIVSSYLQHGLVENNPEKIAFAPDVTITENGRLDARGVDAAHGLLRGEPAATIASGLVMSNSAPRPYPRGLDATSLLASRQRKRPAITANMP